MLKHSDILLIIILGIISFSCMLLIANIEETGENVVITIDGKLLENIPLDKDGTYKFSDGHIDNTIEISQGKVKMIEANCPDKLCIKKNSISLSGQTIICLPNKLVVEVQKKVDDNEVDTIAE